MDPEIIGEDEDDVWLFVRRRNAPGKEHEQDKENREKVKLFHGGWGSASSHTAHVPAMSSDHAERSEFRVYAVGTA